MLESNIMRCEFCGAEIEADKFFCSKCGKSSSRTKNLVEDEEPELILKPVFVLGSNLGGQIGMVIFFSIWSTGFFGILINIPIIATADVGFGISPIPFIIVGCISLVGLPFLYNYRRKKIYENTEYKIFKDRIEHYEGFFTIKRRIIYFESIAKVSMTEKLYQQKRNLGTILLSTPAMAEMKGYSAGIKLNDIESPEKMYKKLKEMVAKVPKSEMVVTGGYEKGLERTGIID